MSSSANPPGSGYLFAEISAGAVRRNLERLRALLPASTALCPVVKDDAYGLGLDLLLPAIAASADRLAVATPEEALRLRRLGWDGPVLCFYSLSALGGGRGAIACARELIAAGITLSVVSAGEAELVARAAAVTAAAEVHLKVDTGMARAGVWHEEAAALLSAIAAEPRLSPSGVYTHFANADRADKSFAREQLRRFEAVIAAAAVPAGICRHAANSAAVMDLPESHLDMVRPGIAVYGYQPSAELARPLALEPCMRVVARLLQVKEVPAGTATGYGLEHVFERRSRIGLLPVGYGHGYLRALGNRARMRLGGHEVPVRGRVSMDQVVVDLTGLPEPRAGDEVEVVAAEPQAPNSLEALARLAGTIPYELTCAIGPRVERRLVD